MFVNLNFIMNLIKVNLNKKFKILLHVSTWMLLFGVFPLLLYIDSLYDELFLKRSIFQAIIFILLFYTHYFYLIPSFFFKKKQLEYYSFFIALILISAIIFIEFENHYLKDNFSHFPTKPLNKNKVDDNKDSLFEFHNNFIHRPRPSKIWPLYNFLLISFLISGFSLGLRLSEKLIQNERLRKETEKEKLNSELAFLKNQISPHFFFNTLNNIYSLVEINTADGQKAILQLSKLMRYLLYESEKGNTLLSREIEFMNNFIELMKLRLSSKVQLKVVLPRKYADIEIPPLLFISFIENAFKHGVSYKDPSFININMNVSTKEI